MKPNQGGNMARITRKYLTEKYNVDFWKEYSFHLKTMTWVCVKAYDGEFICECRTLQEVEEKLKVINA